MGSNKGDDKPFPYLSLCGAIGFAASMFVFTILELVYASESFALSQRTRVLSVMACMLLGAWASIVSLITAWCPIILGGDRRPWYWVVPLVLGWIVFVESFDWTSLTAN